MAPPMNRTLPSALVVTALAAFGGFAALGANGSGTGSTTSAPAALKPAQVHGAYGKLPLAFEANGGRTGKRVDFIARGSGYTLFLTPAESVLEAGQGKRRQVLRTQLDGAAQTRGVPGRPLPGRINSFIGRDPAKWHTGVRTYGAVRYPSVYPGIDLRYSGRQGRLEYDFVIKPGADPGRISYTIRGSRGLRLDRQGNLLVRTAGGVVRHLKPRIYQRAAGRTRIIAGRFALQGDRVRFRVSRYDRHLPLVIDPILAYSTFLGGSSTDEAHGVAVDSSGNAYITGWTSSSNFPTPGGADTSSSGTDAFVTKLDPSGSTI